MRDCAIATLYVVMLVVAMAWQAATPKVTVAEIPNVKLAEIEGFQSESLGWSDAEKTLLPADTRLDKRLYTAADGSRYLVALVFSGTGKRSIHRPELCLPTQGFRMTDPRTVAAAGREWRLITLDGGTEATRKGFAYTFFNQAGFHTSSHTRRIFQDVWDRSVLNRIDRWVMVTVYASEADEIRLKAFVENLKEVLK